MWRNSAKIGRFLTEDWCGWPGGEGAVGPLPPGGLEWDKVTLLLAPGGAGGPAPPSPTVGVPEGGATG